MSSEERGRRGNGLRGGAGRHPGMSGMSNACARQRSSGHLAVLVWSTAKAGGAMLFRDESRSEEHTSELQSRLHLVCRLLLEKKKQKPLQNLCLVHLLQTTLY